MGKRIGLALCIRPVNIVAELMVYDVYPLSFRIVFPASFPILWVDQVNCSVFVRLPRRFPPVEILVPLDAWLFEAVKSTHQRHRSTECHDFVFVEEE